MLIYSMLIEDEREVARFEDIYRQYRKQMYDLVYSILRDPGDTEDALQEAFLGIARQIRKIPATAPAAAKAYVMTAAKNAALSVLRKRKRQPVTQRLGAFQIPEKDDMLEKVMLNDDYALLFQILSAMPLAQREVLMLRHVQGLQIQQIASITGKTVNNTRVQLHRARQELIKRCREEGMSYVCTEETDSL